MLLCHVICLLHYFVVLLLYFVALPHYLALLPSRVAIIHCFEVPSFTPPLVVLLPCCLDALLVGTSLFFCKEFGA
jgi:hypothetical protein